MIGRAMSGEMLDRVTGAIRTLIEDRGASLAALQLQAALMTLPSVVARASDHGRVQRGLDFTAAVARGLLEDAAASLDHADTGQLPNRTVAARRALALEVGSQGRPFRGRRNAPGRLASVADALGYAPESLNVVRLDGSTPLGALIQDLAEFIVVHEVRYLVEQERQAQARQRAPLDSAIQIDWLARFEIYYAMWSSVNGLRNDIVHTIEHLRSDNTAEADLMARKALYYYTDFVARLEVFTRNGGLWLFPDREAEQRIANAVYLIRSPTPLTEIDQSVLRLVMPAGGEVALFIDATYRDVAARVLAEKWLAWLRSCRCRLGAAADPACLVHKTATECCVYEDLVDAEWDSLVDWYDVGRPPKVEPSEVRRSLQQDAGA
jgi:hypothetical protein